MPKSVTQPSSRALSPSEIDAVAGGAFYFYNPTTGKLVKLPNTG